MENNAKISAYGIKTLSIVGLVFALSIGIYAGSVNLFGWPESLSKLAATVVSITSTSKPAPDLSVSASALSIASGDTVKLSWQIKNAPADGGLYTFSYACAPGVSVLNANNENEAIICGLEYPLPENKDDINLILRSDKTRYGNADLTVSFTPRASSEKTIFANTLITISNQTVKAGKNSAPELPTKPKNQTTTNQTAANKSPVTAGNTGGTGAKTLKPGNKTETTVQVSGVTSSVSNPNGKPDLAVKIIATGIVDPNTKEFVATTTPKASDRIAVQFEIANLGTKESGSWYFNAVLPTIPFYIFSSDGQASLMPGDKIVYTLGFDKIEKKDGNMVVINADPANSINEASENNNIAKTTIDGVVF